MDKTSQIIHISKQVPTNHLPEKQLGKNEQMFDICY